MGIGVCKSCTGYWVWSIWLIKLENGTCFPIRENYLHFVWRSTFVQPWTLTISTLVIQIRATVNIQSQLIIFNGTEIPINSSTRRRKYIWTDYKSLVLFRQGYMRICLLLKDPIHKECSKMGYKQVLAAYFLSNAPFTNVPFLIPSSMLADTNAD